MQQYLLHRQDYRLNSNNSSHHHPRKVMGLYHPGQSMQGRTSPLFNIVCMNNKVSFIIGNISCYHIKHSFVVPYCRCIYTTGIAAAFKFKLRTSVKAVSGKFPVYKIAGCDISVHRGRIQMLN